MSLTLFSAIIHDYKFIDIAMMLLLHTQIHITHCSTKEIFTSLYHILPLEIECLFLMIRNVVPFELNKYISHMFISCHVGTINKTKIFRIIFRFFKNLSSVSANQRRVYKYLTETETNRRNVDNVNCVNCHGLRSGQL